MRPRPRLLSLVALRALALVLLPPGAAFAAPILGGTTRLGLDPTLTALGLEADALGTAEPLDEDVFALPVTGGEADDALREGVILHAGAGFVLSDARGAVLELTDVRFDLLDGIASASLRFDDAAGTTATLPDVAFGRLRRCAESVNIDPCRDTAGAILATGLGLDWSATGALFANDAFFPFPAAERLFEGDPLALVASNLVFVPEPASGLLVALGLGALGRRRARRSAAAPDPRRARLRARALLLALLATAPIAVAPTCAPDPAVVVIPGLEEEVRVVTDRFGKAHLFARNDADLMRVQGYVHARDRLFQMDLLRRQAQGRLAEVLGPDALGDDVEARAIGLEAAAQRNLEILDDEARAAVQTYVDGINAYIDEAEARGDLPAEYAALELTRVRRWSLLDTFLVGKVFLAGQSLSLDTGSFDLLEGFVRAGEAHDPPFDGRALFFEDVRREAPFEESFTVSYPEGEAPFVVPGGVSAAAAPPAAPAPRADFARLARLTALVERIHDEHTGSNWWGATGAVTDTGQPILAGDPHLGFSNPSRLYAHHLVVTGDPVHGDMDYHASTLPGIPIGAAPGQNEAIAIAATTNPGDLADVFADRLVVNRDRCPPFFYLCIESEGALHPVEVTVETDYRENTPDDGVFDNLVDAGVPLEQRLVFRVPFRSNGAIIDIEDTGVVLGQGTETTALVLQWVGFEPTREFETLLALPRVRSWDAFLEALRGWDAISNNFLYLDREGHLGYVMTGEIPLRADLEAGGDPRCLRPYFVRDGTGPCNWVRDPARSQGQSIPYSVLPAEELPQALDPPSGLLVNANNDPVGVSRGNDLLANRRRAKPEAIYYFGSFTASVRAPRIDQVLAEGLASGGTLTLDEIRNAQGDTKLLDAEKLLPHLLAAFENASRDGAPAELASLAADARVAEAIGRLAEWDLSTPTGIAAGYDAHDTDGVRTDYVGRREAAHSVAATLYAVWRAQVFTAVIEDTLARVGAPRLGQSRAAASALRTLLERAPFTGVGVSGVDFFPEPAGLAAADRRDAALLGALATGLDLLASEAFADAFDGSSRQDDYRWGRLHRVRFPHPIGGSFDAPPAGGFADVSPTLSGVARDGGWETINVASHDGYADDDQGFAFRSGPARRVLFTTDGTRVVGFEVTPGGYSERAGTRGFLSQLARWLTTDLVPLAYTEAEASAGDASVEVFRAEP